MARRDAQELAMGVGNDETAWISKGETTTPFDDSGTCHPVCATLTIYHLPSA